MKRLVLITISLLVSYSLMGEIYTVNNNPESPGQFTVIQNAIDSAVTGDTIMVSGSDVEYNGFTISQKTLTMIGAGYKNDFGKNTIISGSVKLTKDDKNFTAIVESSGGSFISGFQFNKTFKIDAGDDGGDDTKMLKNIIVERCRFDKDGKSIDFVIDNYYKRDDNTYDSITVRNSIVPGNVHFGGGSHDKSEPRYEEINFLNNVFSGTILKGYYSNLSTNDYLDLSRIEFDHNIFINTKSNNVFDQTTKLVMSNNIFYGAKPQGCKYCTFNSNLSEGSTEDSLQINTNGGNNKNIIDKAPQFVSYSLFEEVDLAKHDYHLQSSSPAKGAATDGTDIGVYGGSASPIEVGADPAVPQIIMFNFKNGKNSVAKGDSLKIRFKSKKQD